MNSATQTTADKVSVQRPSYRIWACKIGMMLVIMLVGGELVSRVFWKFDRKAPLLSPNSLRYAYYRQLRTTGADNAAATKTDGMYDILILGGSTISEEYGPIGAQLKAGLAERLGRPVRVFNLAFPAHNSRDSLLKHRWLADQRFDLIVAYDGYNDVRMNNVPPDLFRDDYSHCYWYQCVSRLDEHPLLFQSALPFTLLFAVERGVEEAGLARYMPKNQLNAAWVEHGKDIRTRATYQRNLEEIIATAKQRNERVVAMTFAYHIPANYSREAFVAGKLDYSDPNATPVETWGKPAHVVAGIRQHNDMVRELAAQNTDVVFVDQDRLMERGRQNFTDCCHLTPEGCTAFAQNILAALDARN